jgi:hypothetical protein
MADGKSLFEDSEATRADLKNLLGLALERVKANIYLAQLMIWVFNTSEPGKPLRKSYEQLSSRPWGLCCSRNQAYATVRQAKLKGILRVQETWVGPEIQGPNEYLIDWDGVRRVVGLRPGVTYPTTCDPPPTTCDPPPTTCDPPPTTCDPYKEYTFVHPRSPSHTRPNDRSNALRLSPEEHRQRIAQWLDREGVWDVPQLKEARARLIVAMPPEALVLDPFQPLAQSHLSDVVPLVRWFRRQLSLTHPVTGQTEAELLLVLAAGRAAAELPANQVKSSRRGIFISTVTRGIWRPVLWHVPIVVDELQKLVSAYPSCLQHPEWPGPKAPVVEQQSCT